MRDESLCEVYGDIVKQTLMNSNIVSSDLPLDDWYGSVMGIIQQVASHHFGVKSTSPCRHWMTPEAWNDIVTRQAQVSKLVEYWRAPLQFDDSRSIFRMWHIIVRLEVQERRVRASCREAEARHAASTCAQLDEAVRAHDYRPAWEHCRLLARHSRRSVKPRAVPPEKALDPGALGAHTAETSAQMKNGKATTTWSVPAELHQLHLARADQLTFDRPIPLHMLWYFVLGTSVSLMDEGFLTVWRSDMQSGSVPVAQVAASVNNSGML